VLHLKAELSSLLAFLINSEQEKMEVRMLWYHITQLTWLFLNRSWMTRGRFKRKH
jgi:hypothetical protein